MKKQFTQLRLTALAGLALAASIGASQAQTFITTSYTNNFDVGTNTANFAGSGSVASWIYWYNTPGGNSPMTNDVSEDHNNNSASGSLQVVSPFLGVPGTQDVFFGTFNNGGGYDFSERANLTLYTNITFYIRMEPGVAPRQTGGTNTDYGTIGVGMINANYGYEQFGAPTIPLAASNAWVQLNVPIDQTQANLASVPGIAFDIANYGGYPVINFTNEIDSLVVHLSPFTNPPPKLLGLQKAQPGLNAIASVTGAGGQYNRYQVCTVADTGLGFLGQPSVTYSWNITSFPTLTGGNFQQHFFIVGNYAPGQYDQAADYNLPDVFWITVQQSDAGAATINFRLKTNEPGGNGMLFNTVDYTTNLALNTNMWPVEPIASATNVTGAIGTWSVTIANSTNITLSGPGVSTNFNITAAQAALFADPVSLVLGGQPNNPNGAGKAVVYSSFSATGVPSPFSDNFTTDSTLNTSIWKNLSSDTNGLYLVPTTAAYWLPWTIPDAGFSLQQKASLNSPGGWTLPNVPIIRVNGADQALLSTAQLPSATQGYFELISFTASQLQVLLGGQTNAPGTLLGYTGSPTNVSGADIDGATVTVTINAVDPTFHIVSGNSDSVTLTSTADPNDSIPSGLVLVNGTLTTSAVILETGNFTFTATDGATPPLAPGTSASVEVDP
jgi:hypothetical protein